MNSEIKQNSTSASDLKKWCLAVTILFTTFFLYSLICCPVPAVNEPHYLTKAKHYWNPEWCKGDFFLESSNPHQVFYQTVGILTLWFSLETTAIIGRIIGYLLLVIGWFCFFRQVTSSIWKSIGVAWIFLGLMTLGNLSGEWMVGGIESKVFSYAFLLMAWGKSLQKKNQMMMIFHGLAISFHPIVGIWGLLANCGARTLSAYFHKTDSLSMVSSHFKKLTGVWAISFGLLVFFSLPGLIPALQLFSATTDGININEVNHIQVYYRLKHHLDPMHFPAKAWGYYSFQIVGILILFRFLSKKKESSEQLRHLIFLMLMACLFATGGYIVGWRSGSEWEMPFFATRMKLLKFYSFRLADVLVPMTFSVILMQFLSQVEKLPKTIVWMFAFTMLVISFVDPPLGGNPSRYSRQKLTDWLDVCEWLQKNSPEESLIFAPKNSWAFKWYAERPEFVCMKDCPQDPEGIKEWNNRLLALAEWGEVNYDNGYTPEDLMILNKKYGITHLVSARLGPIHQKPIYENKTYRVYANH